MEYNKFIENKETLIRDFSPFFNLNIDNAYFLKLVDVVIHQPADSYVDCLIKSKAYLYTVDFIIESVDGPNKGYRFTVPVDIPKMGTKGFILLNKDGILRWKAPIIIGDIKVVIQKYKDRIETSLFKMYMSEFTTKNGFTTYSRIDNSDNSEDLFSYKTYPYLKYLGVSEEKLKKYFKETDDDMKSTYKPIQIPEGEEGEKLRMKFFQLTKTELKGKSFSGEDLFKLIELYHEKPEYMEKFSPFDITFINQYMSMILALRTRKWTITRRFTESFKKIKRFDGNYLSREINSIFTFIKEEEKDVNRTIQSGSDSNAGSFLSQTNKIYFKKFGQRKKIEYTPDFLGLICPLKTPEGVGLVNIKNELARNITIDDGKAYVSVYNKDGEKLTLDYFTYYKSKVLNTSCYDYDNKKILPVNGNIQYLYAGDFYTEKYESDNQFDYIRCSDSDMFAYNTAMVPMMNKNDSIRISMSTNMMDQAIPIKGAHPPIVATGVEKEVYDNSDMTYKSDVDGEVVGIIDNFIKIIEKDTNRVRIISTPPNLKSLMDGTYNIYHPTVKKGDQVKKGQVILASNSFKDGQLSLTVPLLAAYTHYEFADEEDGFAIREGVCDLLAHEMEGELVIKCPVDLRCIFSKDEVINAAKSENILNKRVMDQVMELSDYGLPIVGKKYVKGDIVCAFLQQEDPRKSGAALIRESIKDLAKNKLNIETKYNLMLKTLPYGMQEGVVTEVQVAIPPGITEDGLPKLRDYYKDLYDKENKSISEFLNNESIIEKQRINYDKDYRIIVYVKFKYNLQARIGDKISNRFGSKGSIVSIIPDADMPRVGGPKGQVVDIIISPKARFNRKNPATDIESTLGLVSKCAYDKGAKLLEERKFGEYANMLNLIHVTDRYTKASEQELINYHKSQDRYYQLIVTAMDKKYTKDKVLELCRYFDININEGYNLYLPTYDEMTRNKVEIGITNIMRLHFLVADKLRATSELDSENGLVFGIGRYRPGGQRIGEMEKWALMSHGTAGIVEELSGKSMKDLTMPKLEMEYLFLGLVIGKEDIPPLEQPL